MVPQRSGVEAELLAGRVARGAGNLRLAIPNVADQLPVNEVGRGVNGQTRERDKGRADAEEGLVDVDAAGVRVPPGEDGIVKCRV